MQKGRTTLLPHLSVRVCVLVVVCVCVVVEVVVVVVVVCVCVCVCVRYDIAGVRKNILGGKTQDVECPARAVRLLNIWCNIETAYMPPTVDMRRTVKAFPTDTKVGFPPLQLCCS